MILVYYNRKYGIHTSAVLFIFWFFMAIGGIPQFRTEIRKGQRGVVHPELYTNHVIYFVHYPLVLLMFLLNCIADQPPTESKYKKSEVSNLHLNIHLLHFC